MKPIRESRGGDRYGHWTYEDLVDSMELGDEVVKVDSGGEYQGDTLALYRLPGKDDVTYGFLAFGWGSCSGCDALEACMTAEGVTELRDELFGSIRWFAGLREVVEWLDADHQLQSYGHWESWQSFEAELRTAIPVPDEIEGAIDSIRMTIQNQNKE